MSDEEPEREPSRPLWRRLVPLGLLLLLFGFALQQGWHESLELETFLRSRAHYSAFIENNFLIGIAVYFLVVVVFVAAAIPGATPLTLFGGVLFGKVVGAFAVVLGATCGGLIMFAAARTSLGDTLNARFGPRLLRFRDGFQRNALNYLLSLRLIPLFPFWLITLAASFLGLRVRTFVVGTALGITPFVGILCTVGEGIDDMLRQQQAQLDACMAGGATPVPCEIDLSMDTLLSPTMIIALLALSLLSIAPVVIKRLRNKSSRATPELG